MIKEKTIKSTLHNNKYINKKHLKEANEIQKASPRSAWQIHWLQGYSQTMKNKEGDKVSQNAQFKTWCQYKSHSNFKINMFMSTKPAKVWFSKCCQQVCSLKVCGIVGSPYKLNILGWFGDIA